MVVIVNVNHLIPQHPQHEAHLKTRSLFPDTMHADYHSNELKEYQEIVL